MYGTMQLRYLLFIFNKEIPIRFVAVNAVFEFEKVDACIKATLNLFSCILTA